MFPPWCIHVRHHTATETSRVLARIPDVHKPCLATHHSHTSAVAGSGIACWKVEGKEMRFWSYLGVMRLENEVSKWPSLWHALTSGRHGSGWNALLSSVPWSKVENLSLGSTQRSAESREMLIIGAPPVPQPHPTPTPHTSPYKNTCSDIPVWLSLGNWGSDFTCMRQYKCKGGLIKYAQF